MIEKPLISNTSRVTQSDVAIARQPFRNLINGFMWHTGAMIEQPIISNTPRVTQSDAAIARQPFRNLINGFVWHTGAMIEKPIISNTSRDTHSDAVPARVIQDRLVQVMPSGTPPRAVELPASTLSLLETVAKRLQELLRARHDDSPVVDFNSQQAYTRTQAARLLNVSVWTIDRARKQGLLIEACPIGKRDVRITGDSLFAFMQKKENASVRVRNL